MFEDKKIIKIRNDRGKDIAKIVFDKDGCIKDEELVDCWVHDVDGTDETTVYKIDLIQDISTLKNYSNEELLNELASRLKE